MLGTELQFFTAAITVDNLSIRGIMPEFIKLATYVKLAFLCASSFVVAVVVVFVVVESCSC